MASKTTRTLKCTMCGRPLDENRHGIQGVEGCICLECLIKCISTVQGELFDDEDDFRMTMGTLVDAYEDQFEQHGPSASMPEGWLQPSDKLPTPAEMKAHLDEYVIGQEHAKRSLCVAVYNHYKRIFAPADQDGVELQKSNILLVGPTGSGKTYLAQTLARMLKVPFAIADATSLTEAGYVGEDVENILLRLIQAADGDIEAAQKGIIYIDEIDKISTKAENTSITRDVSGEGVQQALLKIVEGTDASVPPQGGRKHPMQDMIHIDTTNILFICGGAFDGLVPIIESRIGKKMLGFGAELQEVRSQDVSRALHALRPEDLIKYGLIPEFVGRLPVVTTLDALDEEALAAILTKPRNALCRQYEKLLAMDGVDLQFDPEAIRAIAKKAIERKCGARGLRAIIEEIMLDTMFELPGRTDVIGCRITTGSVNGGKPELIYDEKPAAEEASAEDAEKKTRRRQPRLKA